MPISGIDTKRLKFKWGDQSSSNRAGKRGLLLGKCIKCNSVRANRFLRTCFMDLNAQYSVYVNF